MALRLDLHKGGRRWALLFVLAAMTGVSVAGVSVRAQSDGAPLASPQVLSGWLVYARDEYQKLVRRLAERGSPTAWNPVRDAAELTEARKSAAAQRTAEREKMALDVSRKGDEILSGLADKPAADAEQAKAKRMAEEAKAAEEAVKRAQAQLDAAEAVKKADAAKAAAQKAEADRKAAIEKAEAERVAAAKAAAALEDARRKAEADARARKLADAKAAEEAVKRAQAQLDAAEAMKKAEAEKAAAAKKAEAERTAAASKAAAAQEPPAAQGPVSQGVLRLAQASDAAARKAEMDRLIEEAKRAAIEKVKEEAAKSRQNAAPVARFVEGSMTSTPVADKRQTDREQKRDLAKQREAEAVATRESRRAAEALKAAEKARKDAEAAKTDEARKAANARADAAAKAAEDAKRKADAALKDAAAAAARRAVRGMRIVSAAATAPGGSAPVARGVTAKHKSVRRHRQARPRHVRHHAARHRRPHMQCRQQRASGRVPGWYVVTRGDSLWRIAKRHYGSGSRYKAIYRANRKRIANPRHIYPCQRLRLPVLKPKHRSA